MNQKERVEKQIHSAELRIEWAKNAKIDVLKSNMPMEEQFQVIRRLNNTILFCQEQLEVLWAKRAALAKQEAFT